MVFRALSFSQHVILCTHGFPLLGGIDYFNEMMPALHNYVTVDTATFLTGANGAFVNAVCEMSKKMLEADQVQKEVLRQVIGISLVNARDFLLFQKFGCLFLSILWTNFCMSSKSWGLLSKFLWPVYNLRFLSTERGPGMSRGQVDRSDHPPVPREAQHRQHDPHLRTACYDQVRL